MDSRPDDKDSDGLTMVAVSPGIIRGEISQTYHLRAPHYHRVVNCRVAYVGSVLPPEQVALHTAVSVAGNQYQTGFLRSVSSRAESLVVLTVSPNAMWRGKSGSKIYVRGWRGKLGPNVDVVAVPYLNAILLKQGFIAVGLFVGLLRWAWQSRDQRDRVIIVYNTFSYIAGPALFAARLTRSKIAIVLADVPLRRSDARWLRRAEDRAELSLISRADGLVGLTRYTGEDFGVDVPTVVVEGGWGEGPPAIRAFDTLDNGETFNVVYAGALDEVSGLELLLETIERVRTRYVQFHIYGAGPLEHLAQRAARQSPSSVVFYGYVPHDVVMAAEASADLLVCPRVPDGYVTRYTFPSKIIEYLSAGVPVLCNALEGLTPEYLEFLHLPPSPVATDWAACIDRLAADKNAPHETALRASHFIRTQKRWEMASPRLATFLREVCSKDGH